MPAPILYTQRDVVQVERLEKCEQALAVKCKTVHVIIAGKVQGVFFRDYTLQKAQELGVNGWVRNLPNGSVEAILNGQPDTVDSMIEWFYSGSPLSLVTDVEVDELWATEPLIDFEIRYS